MRWYKISKHWRQDNILYTCPLGHCWRGRDIGIYWLRINTFQWHVKLIIIMEMGARQWEKDMSSFVYICGCGCVCPYSIAIFMLYTNHPISVYTASKHINVLCYLRSLYVMRRTVSFVELIIWGFPGVHYQVILSRYAGLTIIIVVFVIAHLTWVRYAELLVFHGILSSIRTTISLQLL